jgi:hypothetical protein
MAFHRIPNNPYLVQCWKPGKLLCVEVKKSDLHQIWKARIVFSHNQVHVMEIYSQHTINHWLRVEFFTLLLHCRLSCCFLGRLNREIYPTKGLLQWTKVKWQVEHWHNIIQIHNSILWNILHMQNIINPT